IGVMGDLGMHTVHIPFRLGWKPQRVFAQLQKGFAQRPDGQGGTAECDTWDNATLNCDVEIDNQTVPMRLQQKRLAPGQTNSWHFEAIGTEGGVRYNTRDANTIFIYEKEKDGWTRIDLGHAMAFPVITGGIFEAGFPDLNLQMWAAYAAERAGKLAARFGCATPEEAVQSHELWQAALKSHAEKAVVEL
ncbi:MAG: gfo/Idh/MocA family oxidoreductase, partial [Verrucomicrobiales bacterium]|nr:gfo/Idh/MocA family oxidoreductase [Verrucomicrobiales bacterium]